MHAMEERHYPLAQEDLWNVGDDGSRRLFQ